MLNLLVQFYVTSEELMYSINIHNIKLPRITTTKKWQNIEYTSSKCDFTSNIISVLHSVEFYSTLTNAQLNRWSCLLNNFTDVAKCEKWIQTDRTTTMPARQPKMCSTKECRSNKIRAENRGSVTTVMKVISWNASKNILKKQRKILSTHKIHKSWYEWARVKRDSLYQKCK